MKETVQHHLNFFQVNHNLEAPQRSRSLACTPSRGIAPCADAQISFLEACLLCVRSASLPWPHPVRDVDAEVVVMLFLLEADVLVSILEFTALSYFLRIAGIWRQQTDKTERRTHKFEAQIYSGNSAPPRLKLMGLQANWKPTLDLTCCSALVSKGTYLAVGFQTPPPPLLLHSLQHAVLVAHERLLARTCDPSNRSLPWRHILRLFWDSSKHIAEVLAWCVFSVPCTACFLDVVRFSPWPWQMGTIVGPQDFELTVFVESHRWE